MIAPPQPKSLADTGLNPVMLRDILLKTMFRMNLDLVTELSRAICLPVVLTQELIDTARGQRLIEAKGTLNATSGNEMPYQLTDAGKSRALDALSQSEYYGALPVPLDMYAPVSYTHLDVYKRQAYYRAAAEQGMNSDTLSAIGSADLALGRVGQAEDVLRRAIKADPTFVPALNNLGVVLMNEGKPGEARVMFQQAFALDSGQSDAIRENLRLAIAQSEASVYDPEQEEKPVMKLVRRGQGTYDLLSEL